jgi:erythronate-4-phosphate dehydrogenase
MNKKPHIIADCHIPFLKGTIDEIVDVTYLPAEEITAQSVKNADALLIRTRTKCNQSLLAQSKVQFIGTATIGYDHIDTFYCQQNNIVWKNAPGCNAASVAQYVVAALLYMAQKHAITLAESTIGIIGVGHVGKQVAHIAKALGMRVLLNDPPRQAREHLPHFVSVQEIAEQANFITYHTPYTTSGLYPTHHIFNQAYCNKLKNKPIIINTARGEIVDTNCLLLALETHRITDCVIDCWENEPLIAAMLAQKVGVATPHIAGYSADGKANATRMMIAAVTEHFGINTQKINQFSIPHPIKSCIFANSNEMQDALYELVSQSYNIFNESCQLKNDVSAFESMRNEYPLRREFFAYTVQLQKTQHHIAPILTQLGFNIQYR